MEAAWAGRNERIQAVRDARKHLKPPRVPPEAAQLTNLPPSKDMAVEDFIRHAQGLFAQELPTVHREPLDSTSTSDRERAERVAKWLHAAHERMFGPPGNVFAKIADAFPQDGQAVVKVLLRQKRWHIRRGKNEEAEAYNERVTTNRRSYFPFACEHVDTKNYYPQAWDEEGRPAEVLEITQREKGPLYEQFGEDLGMPVDMVLGSDTFGEVTRHVEYWNQTHYAYHTMGMVKVAKHPGGRPAYFSADFSTTSIQDRKFLTEGLADPLVPIQEELESIKEMIKAYGFWTAYPPLPLVPVGEEIFPLRGDVKVVIRPLANPQGVPRGYKVEPMRMPPMGETILRHYENLKEEKDRLMMAPILLGKLDHTLSGPAMTSQVDLAKSIFGVAEANLAALFDGIDRWMLEMIDTVLKEPVPVESTDKATKGQWREIGPDDIRGYYRVKNRVQPITRIAAAIIQQLAADAHARGAIDDLAYRANLPPELMDGADPLEMDRRVRRQDFRNSNVAKTKVWTEATAIVDQLLHPEAVPEQGTPTAEPAGPSGYGPQIVNQPPLAGTTDVMTPPPEASVGVNPAAPPGNGAAGGF